MKNWSIIIIFMLLAVSVNGQDLKPHDYEVGLGYDNDFLVVFTETDYYYTYGINESFRWLGESEHFYFSKYRGHNKYYTEISFNMDAYTPNYRPDGSVDNNEERSYAGWSYFNLSQNVAFSDSFLRIGVGAGVLGPNSKTGQVQNWFHRQISGDPELEGWDSQQLPVQLGINVKAAYGIGIFRFGPADIYATVDESIGNIEIYARPMIHFRFGEFGPVQYSVAQDNQLLGVGARLNFLLIRGSGKGFGL